MTTIHWVHAGIDACFGLNRLIHDRAGALRVWTRSAAPLDGIAPEIQQPYAPEALWDAVAPGDVIVAPRPTDLAVAQLALERGAHLAVGWHASRRLREIAGPARDKGLIILAEAGMVPGIEHLMARDLVNDYRQQAEAGDVLHFTCYGGGMPRFPDNFRHKFNTSPLSLLNALATPTSWIGDGKTRSAAFPFDAIHPHDLHLPTPERHQVYPHYDVAPYLEAYGFDPDWTIATAQRGAIRLKGWDEGWSQVFATIRQSGKDAAILGALADELWRDHPFMTGEADRAVLSVALRAEGRAGTRWHREWVMDASGGRHGFVRFRLNALMLALAAEAIIGGRVPPGLNIGVTDPELIANWLVEITHQADYARRLNHDPAAGDAA
ncbi:MAG: saccharopine dehydrogenase C-terminal domain-containing protein [Paracoccus sp. (in: a-proteobacteria)]|nr:saccharopine dehydrogenase C-terminal domain-containing protein [Paracoccus sp. (in: a-proteobacteria)]